MYLGQGVYSSDGFTISKSASDAANAHGDLLNEAELAAAAEEKETHSFEIDPAKVMCYIFYEVICEAMH